jgi:hypothetical protein
MYNFSLPDLQNIYIPDGATPGMFTVGPLGAPVSVSGVEAVPTQGIATMEAPVAPLGNTDYTIRETPASALSMLGGLPVSVPAEVAAYLSSQPQIVSPFEGMPSLVGAQDIFGGRSYVTHSAAGPSKARVGLMEMKQLNQAEGYNTTIRPEFLGETYLPFRPEGNDPNVVNDTKLWHQYYTDNKDYRKFLSADEQTELAWLDYRTGLTDKNQFTSAVNQVRENFNLPQKVAFEDFEAHFSIGTKRKKYSDNPYQDLQEYGPAIGGYWNPENDPSETQQVLSNPFVQGVITSLASYFGGPVGAALASTATTRATGADWTDALQAGAMAGAGSFVDTYAPGLFGNLNPQVSSALIKGARAFAQGGDIKDVLVSAGLGYAGGPGGMLSKTLGDLGLNVGEGVISKAIEGLSLADVAKFGFKSTQDFGSALGGLIQNMDLGTLEQTGLLGVLPEGLQDAIRKVQLSDVLAAGAGGLDQGLAMNIINDINLPFNIKMGMLTGNVEIPQWMKDAYQAAKQGVQTAAEAVEGVVQPAARAVAEGAKTALEAAEEVVQPVAEKVKEGVQAAAETVEGVVQPAARAAERVAEKTYSALEQAIQDATSAILPANPGSMFNIPNVDLFGNIPDINMPNVNTPDVNLSAPNLALNMPSSSRQSQKSMFEEYIPYQFGGLSFNPRAPVIPMIQPRGQDPLSILLRG